MKKFLSKAFSLVELMVTLIVVSCLIAAMAPVMTKKLKSNSITIGSSGASESDGGLSMDCSKFGPNCNLCYTDKCVSCVSSCAENQALDIAQCACKDCNTLFGNACLKCDVTKCSKCSDTYYLNEGACATCDSGYYCDGTNKIICPVGYYCENGTKTVCSSGTYNDATGGDSASSCKLCATKTPNCTNCNRETGICSTCADGYEINNEICEENGFEFTYTGAYTTGESTNGKLKITMTSKGEFTALGNATGTIFLVGGGGSGGEGGTTTACGSSTVGSVGCGGANLQTEFTFVKDTTYTVEIGTGKTGPGSGCWQATCCEAGKQGGTTKFGTLTATGGLGGKSCAQGTTISCTTSSVTFDGATYGKKGGGSAANMGHGGGQGGSSGSGVAIIILN